jgi:hypothetical protein
MDDALDAAHEPGTDVEGINTYNEIYDSLQSCREQLKVDILNDDYSTEEVEEAALRLEKIKKD